MKTWKTSKSGKRTFDSSGAFLDWTNNYLTLEVFASDYRLTTSQAETLINAGRNAHNDGLCGFVHSSRL